MKLFGKRKERLPEEKRVPNSASSFSFSVGDVFALRDADEAKNVLKDRRGYNVILLPGDDLYSNPREWAKALSNAGYLIVVSDEKSVKSFLSFVDSIVFSPLTKQLTGCIALTDSSQIKNLAATLEENGAKTITIVPR